MKLIRGLTMLLTLLFAAQGATAQINRFNGKWRNADPNTGGITRLQIDVEGTTPWLKAWGKCHPRDCAFGEMQGIAYGQSVGANLLETAELISAIQTTSFSQMIILIRPIEDDQLEVEWMTRFTDQSGRASYTRVETFTRVHEPGAAK